MRKLRDIFICCFTFFILINASACVPYSYKGERADLYTVAVNNIFRANGYFASVERFRDPHIKVLEIDDYGRVLFCYDESMAYYEEGHQYEDGYEKYYYACLIMQKSSDGFVYYYEDLCYETYLVESKYPFLQSDLEMEVLSKDFSNLKQLNDWGKEINEEKCVKKSIITKNKGVLDIKDKTFEEITRKYATLLGDKGKDVIYRYDVYNTGDIYGRELYYVWGVSRDVYGEGVSPTSTARYFHFAIIFNPDGSYNQETCITEISDLANFKSEIIALKSANQWNEPFYIDN